MDTTGNLAYDAEWRGELIGGKIVAMSAPSINHMRIADNISGIFREYLRGKSCEFFPAGTADFLSEEDHFIPDGMVVCHTEIIGEHTVNGPPDLVIEILSRSTWQIDRGHKKDAYEAAGVREYWIVDPVNMILEQYVLSGSRYALVCVAAYVPERQMEGLDERERAALCSEFPCGILPGLTIRLKDVFNRVTLPRQ